MKEFSHSRVYGVASVKRQRISICLLVHVFTGLVSTASNTSCTTTGYGLVWPRYDHTNICRLKGMRNTSQCKGRVICDLDCKNTTCDYPWWRTDFKMEYACKDTNQTPPGMPRRLKVTEVEASSALSFHVNWEDPEESDNLVGYRLDLNLSVTYTYHISLKALRDSGLNSGKNKVIFTSDKTVHSESGIMITPAAFAMCFVRHEHQRNFSVTVTSLPLKSEQDQTSRSKTRTVQSCRDLGWPNLPIKKLEIDCAKQDMLKVPDHPRICNSDVGYINIMGSVGIAVDEENKTSATFNFHWERSIPDQRDLQLQVAMGNLFPGGVPCNRSETWDGIKTFSLPKGAWELSVQVELGYINDRTECALVHLNYMYEPCKIGWSFGKSFNLRSNISEPGNVTSEPTLSPSTTPLVTTTQIETTDQLLEDNLKLSIGISVGGLALVISILSILLFLSIRHSRGFQLRMLNGKVRPRKAPCPSVATETTNVYLGCSVYLSYSRYTSTSLEQAQTLSDALKRNQVHVVSDIEPEDCAEMADCCNTWLDEQLKCVDYIVVLLDQHYPLNLSMTEEMYSARLDADFDGTFKLTMAEVNKIQSMEFSGRMSPNQRLPPIIPVHVGSANAIKPPTLPVSMCAKTVYRLPNDYFVDEEQCKQFQQLLHRLSNPRRSFSMQILTSL
eukprot:scpid44051/ scgid1113/ 